MSMYRNEQSALLTERTEPTSTIEALAQSSVPGLANAPSYFNSRSANDLHRAVELHIDELVLNGFAPADRYRIGAAVQSELTRLITELGVPSAIAHEGEMAQLDGGTLQIEPGSRAEMIGVHLAQAIYGGLRK